jgi:cytochrome d ubiquinol oxidase subunit II
VINSVGPVWEGNQVWLILGGGAIFAAWPQLYAVSFSGFYLAMFVILTALILRPVAFKFRSKREDPPGARAGTGCCSSAASCASADLRRGPGQCAAGRAVSLASDMHIFYDGGFFDLLNPFALLCGLLSVAMLVMHGASWLQLKTAGRGGRAGAHVTAVWPRPSPSCCMRRPVSGCGCRCGVMWSPAPSIRWAHRTRCSRPWRCAPVPGSPTTRPMPGRWPRRLLGFVGALGACWACGCAARSWPCACSALAIAGIVLSVGASMFPFILPSSIDPRASLTVWDSSSSHLTLFIMLVVTVFFLPIIVAYTSWVYHVLWGKVDEAAIRDETAHAY